MDEHELLESDLLPVEPDGDADGESVLEVEPSWVWPLPRYSGRGPTVSDGFFEVATNEHRRHLGVDLTYRRLPTEPVGLPRGTKGYYTPAETHVLAAQDGLVTISRQDPKGGRITLDHGNGVRTNYMHLSRRHVDEGQQVKAGQSLGIVGHNPQPSAYAFDHLHFELVENEKQVDPGNEKEGPMSDWLVVSLPILEVETLLVVGLILLDAVHFGVGGIA